MRKLATIQKITALEPIANKDRIELASILGWKVIVGKGEFQVGDLAVYCEYDTLLPIKQEFEFLRSNCFSPKWNGFRIRNMKMAGVFSQGIVFSTPILPKKVKVKEGVDVTDTLEVRKYDPEYLAEMLKPQKRPAWLKYMLKKEWFRKLYFWMKGNPNRKNLYPEDISKSDETNVQAAFAHIQKCYPDHRFYKTEKLEGQAATYEYRAKGKRPKFRVYSHNFQRPKPDGSTWWRYALENRIEEKLKANSKKYPAIAVQGELVGPGIQKNIYELPAIKLYVYSVKNLTTGAYLNYEDLDWYCIENGFEMVPLFHTGCKLYDTVEEVLDEADGKNVESNTMSYLNPNVMREGFVWRSELDQSVGFKAKSSKYLMWWDKKEKAENKD